MTKKFFWQPIIDEGDKTPMESLYYAYYGEEELGFIEWYPKWRKWVWNQGEDIIMSLSCIREVERKLLELEGKE